MFVNFVDGGVGWAKLNDLRANLRNETTIAGAARGGQLGFNASNLNNGFLHHVDQTARGGKEGQTAQGPLNIEFELVFVQYVGQALLQRIGSGLCAKTEVEINDKFAWNDVGSTSARMHIANLPSGGWKKVIACVPHGAGQFGYGRRCFVYRVVGQLGVSNVALNANDLELAAE